MSADKPGVRTPPQSYESELSVLGALLISPSCIADVRAQLTGDDFFRSAHREIYEAIIRRWERGAGVDVLLVHQELGEKSAAVGGLEYLAEIVDAVPTAANVEYHVKVVREQSTLRRLISAANLIAQDAYEGRESTELSASALQRILGASAPEAGGGYQTIGSVVIEAMAEVENEVETDWEYGIHAGIPTLDRMTRGMRPGELTVLAARPSMGKTALAMQIALHAGSREHPTLIASLEMTTRQLVRRALSSHSRLDLHEAVKDPRTSAKLANSASVLHAMPVRIDDQPGDTIQALRAGVLRAAATTPPKLLIVDYLQLMEARGENRNQQVSAISRGLKKLAHEVDCHVIALSQLSREVERRTPPRPQLSDLRDSGAIEQDADVVLLLWRPEYYFDEKTKAEVRVKWEGRGELIVAKQRNGDTGAVRLLWDGPSTRFTEEAAPSRYENLGVAWPSPSP